MAAEALKALSIGQAFKVLNQVMVEFVKLML